MKLFKHLLVMLVLFAVTQPEYASASRAKAVSVTNNTSYTMSEFYASASDNSSWSTDTNLLAGQTIAPGQTATIVISDGLATCRYDLMAVLYGAAQHAYQYRVNACRGGSWTLQ
jgi:hypothetical protein